MDIQASDISIKLSIKQENINESDCSVIIKRKSITIFMFPDGDVPFSGENEEDSAKPLSNRAVQMISGIQDYKGTVDENKKLKKYESLRSPPNSKGDTGFKSMKTTEFVLKEILERKEQDISLDEAQNDGMRSPRQDSVHNKKKSGFNPDAKGKSNLASKEASPKNNILLKTPDLESNNFDSFHTNIEQKANSSGVKKDQDDYDDFDMIPKDSKSRMSLLNDKFSDK